MTPARWPRDEPLDDRLLVVDPRSDAWFDSHVRDLPHWLLPGDLLVVNDAATVPGSLQATDARGRQLELRLAAHLGDARWRAVLFGEGDWRTRTEHRPAPPALAPGDVLYVAPTLSAVVEKVDLASPRLIAVRFSLTGAPLWSALYRAGRPVQYAHTAAPLEIWHVQTPFASRPWAVEMPSACRPLSWALVAKLRRQGTGVAPLTHAAGLSSTGDSAIDALLPLPERFDLPEATVRAVVTARAAGKRIVAVGTTVVRALEGCAALHGGELVAGEAVTDLRIAPGFRPRVVDGVLTGLHDVGSSHRELVGAFAPQGLLAEALASADASGYLGHEFGDVCLVLSPCRVAAPNSST
ncbi:MAG TPA: S-adenosylmethionine:tRNA ribosyltransferase-isomerase [Polyangiaceae bacterium]|jgi:S-adenosylmethionine:tRNA ribosyltransferase-isomerase|nr:S-adenosylmethionine:tRNA ribosyltransferase-isomerase [Polyangiaceae bacterium]